MPPPTKRRKTEPKVEEINFDLSARQEYLTGFHKRKVQRAKHAQEIAERRAREDRIAERKRIRDERKADLERHVREINALFKPVDVEDGSENGQGEDGDWKGIEDGDPPPIDHEAEYIDEDKYTTVTVEAMDVTRDGLAKLGEEPDADAGDGEVQVEGVTKKVDRRNNKAKGTANKQRSEQGKANKTKRKKFRYESKGERKVSRFKERSKNSKQAKARRDG